MIRLPRVVTLATLLLMAAAISLPAMAAISWPHLPHKPQKKTQVENKPLRLRHIAGVVVDKKGLFIPYPAVELRDGKDHHVLATSFADGNGRFRFEDRKPGDVVEIRFSMKGYQATEYTIDVVRIGHETMKAVMSPAM